MRTANGQQQQQQQHDTPVVKAATVVAFTADDSNQNRRGKKREREHNGSIHRSYRDGKETKKGTADGAETNFFLDRIEREQEQFDYCEKRFLPLIRRWRNATNFKNCFNQLPRILRELIGELEDFSAPFIEEYDLKILMSRSMSIIRDKNLQKKVRDKFSSVYGRKMRYVPTGFKAIKKSEKKRSNKISIKNDYLQPTENDILTKDGIIVPNARNWSILNHGLILGHPIIYRYQLQEAFEKEYDTSRLQLQITNAMWEDIQRSKNHPIR